jgi:hypothetical protein
MAGCSSRRYHFFSEVVEVFGFNKPRRCRVLGDRACSSAVRVVTRSGPILDFVQGGNPSQLAGVRAKPARHGSLPPVPKPLFPIAELHDPPDQRHSNTWDQGILVDEIHPHHASSTHSQLVPDLFSNAQKLIREFDFKLANLTTRNRTPSVDFCTHRVNESR